MDEDEPIPGNKHVGLTPHQSLRQAATLGTVSDCCGNHTSTGMHHGNRQRRDLTATATKNCTTPATPSTTTTAVFGHLLLYLDVAVASVRHGLLQLEDFSLHLNNVGMENQPTWFSEVVFGSSPKISLPRRFYMIETKRTEPNQVPNLYFTTTDPFHVMIRVVSPPSLGERGNATDFFFVGFCLTD